MELRDVLQKYRDESFSERDKGTRFERLMKSFLLTYSQYTGLFIANIHIVTNNYKSIQGGGGQSSRPLNVIFSAHKSIDVIPPAQKQLNVENPDSCVFNLVMGGEAHRIASYKNKKCAPELVGRVDILSKKNLKYDYRKTDSITTTGRVPERRAVAFCAVVY